MGKHRDRRGSDEQESTDDFWAQVDALSGTEGYGVSDDSDNAEPTIVVRVDCKKKLSKYAAKKLRRMTKCDSASDEEFAPSEKDEAEESDSKAEDVRFKKIEDEKIAAKKAERKEKAKRLKQEAAARKAARRAEYEAKCEALKQEAARRKEERRAAHAARLAEDARRREERERMNEELLRAVDGLTKEERRTARMKVLEEHLGVKLDATDRETPICEFLSNYSPMVDHVPEEDSDADLAANLKALTVGAKRYYFHYKFLDAHWIGDCRAECADEVYLKVRRLGFKAFSATPWDGGREDARTTPVSPMRIGRILHT